MAALRARARARGRRARARAQPRRPAPARACDGSTMAWDCDAALGVLGEPSLSGVVVAVLCGHDHKAGYARDAATGIHHLTLQSPLNRGDDGACFGVVDVYEERLELRGPALEDWLPASLVDGRGGGTPRVVLPFVSVGAAPRTSPRRAFAAAWRTTRRADERRPLRLQQRPQLPAVQVLSEAKSNFISILPLPTRAEGTRSRRRRSDSTRNRRTRRTCGSRSGSSSRTAPGWTGASS